jgi:hypothetical protein
MLHLTEEPYPEEYDEYIENTPLEARFDPMTIQMICVEAIPRHAAYGMMFDEYQKQRSRFSSYDTSEKKRLSFYFPAFHGRIAADLAIMHNTSQYHFMVLIVELGIITLKYDYHDDYSVIQDCRKELFGNLTTDYNQSLYMQLEQHTIEMCSGMGSRMGKSRHFTPTVPDWLYNAVSDTAVNLNMSTSDFVYLCWCIGASTAIQEDRIPGIVGKDFSAILSRFKMNFESYVFQVQNTLSRMNNQKPKLALSDKYNNSTTL